MALITGASGGIGLDLARVFAREGWDLILVARNAEKLGTICGALSKEHPIQAHALAKDLSAPGSAKALYDEVRSKGWEVDALVNNAGIGAYGLFASTPLSQETELLELNIVSLTQLTKLFLGPMIGRRRGYILNVASTAAFQPGPLMAVYYASKAYVLSFSEALAEELSGTGVSVTALCPGATATGFSERANMKHSRLFKRHVMRSDTVAERGYRGMIRKRRIVITGLANRLMAFSVRLAPRALVSKVVRKIQETDKAGL